VLQQGLLLARAQWLGCVGPVDAVDTTLLCPRDCGMRVIKIATLELLCRVSIMRSAYLFLDILHTPTFLGHIDGFPRSVSELTVNFATFSGPPDKTVVGDADSYRTSDDPNGG